MDAQEPDALGTAEETEPPERPRVVLVVGPPAAGARDGGDSAPVARAAAASAEAEAAPAEAEAAPAEAEAAPAEAEAAPAEAGGSAAAETRRLAEPSALDDEQPTQKIRKPSRERTPEDDRLVAAVIPLHLEGGDPSPLDDFLGRSLLYRAAQAAAAAGAPRLVLLGRVPDDQRQRVHDEAYAAFGGGPIEVLDGDPGRRDLGRGRVLVLDSTALHDGEAVARLAQAKGEKTVLLLGPYGDGLKVRTDEGRVSEIGRDVVDADGYILGACSVPVEHFEQLCGVGERAALESLGSSEELTGLVAPRSFAQQFRNRDSFLAAQDDCYDRLASGGRDTLFEDLLGRPLSRGITKLFLHRPLVTPNAVSVVAGVLALAAAFLLAFGHYLGAQAGRIGALGGGVLLVASAVFDRVDGDLARLRLHADESERRLDFGLDHLAHMLVFLGLAWYVRVYDGLEGVFALPSLGPQLERVLGEYHLDGDGGALRLGFLAAGGVVMLGLVLLWRGPPRASPQPLLTRVADLLATSFGSRDYFYLLVAVAAANLFLPDAGLMALFLLVTTLLVHVFWISILLLTVLAPPRD